MFDKKRALICSIILYILGVTTLIIAIIYAKLTVFAVIASMALLSAVIMTLIYARLKSKCKGNNNKPRTLDEIFNDKKIDDYDKFVEWWSSCDEKEIQSNSLLLGAFQIMWMYNEVCNGGFGQFFDYAKNWNMERTTKLFKWLLPKDFYELFVAALQLHKNGEDCEQFNSKFDYDKMEKQVLPKLAERVTNNYKYKVTLTEYDLIEGITPYLKSQGYKKQNKRWTKNIGDFTLSFYLQGSAYDIDNYYIRPGIFVNGIPQEGLDFYGHFNVDLRQQSLEQVINDYEQFVKEWTNKELIKKRLEQFNLWEQRNPLEKRRTMKGKDRFKNDPIPEGCDVFFSVNSTLMKHILETF